MSVDVDPADGLSSTADAAASPRPAGQVVGTTSGPADGGLPGGFFRVVANQEAALSPLLWGTAPVEIRILGAFSVRGMRGEGFGANERRTHVRALLALVAASAGGVSRDEAAYALWPQQSESGARNRLYHTIHLVRQTLSAVAWQDEWMLLDQGRVQLDPRVLSDAHRVQAAADCGVERLDDAELLSTLALCTGEWAPEVDAGELGLVLRRQLRDSHIAILREAARRQMASGDTLARRRLLANLLEINATDEWAYQQVMALDLAAGRNHTVLRSYETAVRVLGVELGLRPSAALTELAGQAAQRLLPLIAGAQPRDPFVPDPGLVDREELIGLLQSDIVHEPGLWNLAGLSGVGKTALIREVARRAAASLPDGVLFGTLAPRMGQASSPAPGAAPGWIIDPTPRTDALSAAVRALGLAGDCPAQAWRELLATRRALVVLDDVEQCDDWATLLAHVPPELQVRLVLVSRLPVHGPWSVRRVCVPPLSVPTAGTPAPHARQSPSVALFRMRQPFAHVPDWPDSDWQEVIDLVRQLDGLPLAIEAAAAGSATLTPGEILDQLSRRTSDAASFGGHAGQVLDGISDAFDETVALLDANVRCMYRAVAVFEDAFDAVAVEPLLEAAQVPRGVPAAVLLEALVSAGLLTRQGATFCMLNLSRIHARADAQRATVWEAVQRARARQIADRLERHATTFESPGYTRWMSDVAAHHDDAICLLRPMAVGDGALFLRLVVPLAHFWAVQGRAAIGLPWCERGALAAQARGDVSAEFILHALAATLELSADRPTRALVHIESASALKAQVFAPERIAYLVCVHARVLAHDGPVDPALKLLRECLALFPNADRPGYWTLHAALIEIGQTLSSLPASAVESLPLRAWRERLGGSLVWCHLLDALGAGVHGMTRSMRLEIACELLAVARDLHAQAVVQVALTRRNWAMMAHEGVEESKVRVLEWYRDARATGADATARLACLWLAEFAWREGETAAATQWLDAARRFVDSTVDGASRWEIRLHEIAIDVLEGNFPQARERFVAIPSNVVANWRGDAFRQGIEVGAMLARLGGLEHLTSELSQALRLLSDVKDSLPLVHRFRKDYLGIDAGFAPCIQSPAETERAIVRARSDLGTLYDYLGRKQRR